MFEQATLDTRGALKNPWTVGVSVIGQSLAIGAGFLLSVLHTDQLPRALQSIGLAFPPGRPEPVTRQNHPAATRETRSAARVFIAPTRVPTGVAQLHEAGIAAPSLESDAGPGLPGGFGTGTGFAGVTFDTPAPAPPPKVEPAAPTRPAPPPPRPVAVSSGVQAARLIRQIQPVYPQLAIGARVQGTVRLVAIIGHDGAIRNLEVAAGHPLLIPAALSAVRQWLYRPTLLNGEPVEVITQIDVNFTLSR